MQILDLARLLGVVCLMCGGVEKHNEPLTHQDIRTYYEGMCWSVTNYWPFELYDSKGNRVMFGRYKLPRSLDDYDHALFVLDNGGEWRLAQRGGQADSDPTSTALCQGCVKPGATFQWVALPFPLLPTLQNGELGVWAVQFPWGRLRVLDTFGHPAYQAGPIYHQVYQQVVIPVDVFTPLPHHYLECNGQLVWAGGS